MSDHITAEEMDALLETVVVEAGGPSALSALGAHPRTAVPEELVTEYFPLDQTHIDAAAAHLAAGATLGVEPVTLKELRHTHHRLAQLLATGVDEGVAAKLCNYSVSRISMFKADPAFKELLAYYAGNVEERWGDFVSTAANLSLDLLQHLQQQLDEHPERFSLAETREAIKLLADRSGHAPISKTVNLNVNADLGSKLDAARARLRAQQNMDA